MGFLPRVSAVPLSPGAGLMLRSAQLTLAFDHHSTGDGRRHRRSRTELFAERRLIGEDNCPSVRRIWQ